MHVLIDLQCCQSDSRFGGIGRYSMSLAKAMLRLPTQHRFSLLLNGSLPNENAIRAEFAELLPQQDIHTFLLPPFIAADNELPAHTRIAELIREKRIVEIAPDVLHIASLFEGAGENVVTSVGLLFPAERTAVTLYDLIPFLEQETYLGRAVLADHYMRKFEQVQSAGVLVSISAFSRQEAMEHTSIPPERIVNISSAVDGEMFRPQEVEEPARTTLLHKCGIGRPFVMFTGSFDARKNHVRLVKAFARVLPTLGRPCQLVIVGKGLPRQITRLKAIARYHGLSDSDLVFVGHVTDVELVALYNLATLFVFPSLREGFGLPVLEAMSCGIPTIGANRTSVPEVISHDDALFDPLSVEDMAEKLARALSDDPFREELRVHGLERAKYFSWAISASKAIDAFEELMLPVAGVTPGATVASEAYEATYAMFQASLSRMRLGPVSDEFLEQTARVVAMNESLNLPGPGRSKLPRKTGWVTAGAASSVIARHSSRLLRTLTPKPMLFANYQAAETSLDETPARWWTRADTGDVSPLLEALAASQLDVVIIQTGDALFTPTSLGRLIVEQKQLGREVLLILHSTGCFAQIDAAVSVGVKAALKACAGIFVHRMEDVAGLEKFNVRRNVSFVPWRAAEQRDQFLAACSRQDSGDRYLIARMQFALAVGSGW